MEYKERDSASTVELGLHLLVGVLSPNDVVRRAVVQLVVRPITVWCTVLCSPEHGDGWCVFGAWRRGKQFVDAPVFCLCLPVSVLGPDDIGRRAVVQLVVRPMSAWCTALGSPKYGHGRCASGARRRRTQLVDVPVIGLFAEEVGLFDGLEEGEDEA